MKNSSLIIKVLSIVVSVVLIMFFALPKFEDIKAVQNDISAYQEQLANVDRINAQLTSYVNEINAISVTDQSALVTFLPDDMDPIAVTRTLQNIIQTAGLRPQGIGHDDSLEVEGLPVVAHGFSVSATGSYDAMTEFFAQIEQNEYLFEFVALDLSANENGEVVIEAKITTYTMSDAPAENQESNDFIEIDPLN